MINLLPQILHEGRHLEDQEDEYNYKDALCAETFDIEAPSPIMKAAWICFILNSLCCCEALDIQG